jgi:3D (Asp-Asp-Asp) domain-containing protein
MMLRGCHLVLVVGGMMLPVQASAPTALAQVTPGVKISAKTPALGSSSKMRLCLTLTVEVPSARIPAAATAPSAAEIAENPAAVVRLARVTAYWPGEVNGDYDTNCRLSSTGAHLRMGHCAVDPNVIPYGSVISIAGVGRFTAVDTGSAVVSRQAARLAAKTPEEEKALVVDLFFDNAADGEKFAATGPQYAAITWGGSGQSVDPEALESRKRFEKDTQDMVAWVQAPERVTGLAMVP